MDLVTTTPGLQHIAEQIFSNLDRKSLRRCQKVNDHWGNILRNPWFWFNRMKPNTRLSQEHQKEWMDFCEKLSKLNLTKDMTQSLNYIYSKLEVSVKLNRVYWSAILPLSSLFIDSFRYRSFVDIVRIMAPFIENPNGPDDYIYGDTVIHNAALNGHTEIVKILAPLTANPNAPDNYQQTPIFMAAQNGHAEIVKILAPLTDNANAPDNDGNTPIFLAACWGYTEIVKILAPLTGNPNAPNNKGETPSAVAKNEEIRKILETKKQK